jgi:hypothetical protein
MHAHERVHMIQWLDEVFMLYLSTIYAFFVKYLWYYPKKTEPRFMACVPHGDWLGVGLTV